MRFSLALFLLSIPCFSQTFSVGVKAAARVTSDLDGYASSESRIYRVGPMVELALPYHFSFEADALYSRFGYSSTTYGLLGESFTERMRANSWEFPLLAKYRFGGSRRGRWFVSAGYAPRIASARFDDSGYTVSFPDSRLRSPYRNSYEKSFDTDHAVVAGGGLAFQKGHIRIAPEARYLRWKQPLYSYYGSHGYYLSLTQNEVQVLLGITFGVH
jgi:Outer membrane protein beta-barrel domain